MVLPKTGRLKRAFTLAAVLTLSTLNGACDKFEKILPSHREASQNIETEIASEHTEDLSETLSHKDLKPKPIFINIANAAPPPETRTATAGLKKAIAQARRAVSDTIDRHYGDICRENWCEESDASWEIVSIHLEKALIRKSDGWYCDRAVSEEELKKQPECDYEREAREIREARNTGKEQARAMLLRGGDISEAVEDMPESILSEYFFEWWGLQNEIIEALAIPGYSQESKDKILLAAARLGETEVMVAAIENGASYLNDNFLSILEENSTETIRAVWQSMDSDAIEYVFKSGAYWDDIKTRLWFLAMRLNDKDTLLTALSHGCNQEYIDYETLMAIGNEAPYVFRVILRNPGKSGCTQESKDKILLTAARLGETEVMVAAIENGASYLNLDFLNALEKNSDETIYAVWQSMNLGAIQYILQSGVYWEDIEKKLRHLARRIGAQEVLITPPSSKDLLEQNI